MTSCCLSLVFPRSLEDDLADYLLAYPHSIDSMTIIRAEGLGHGLVLRDATEKVRGRAARYTLQIVLPAETAGHLIADLKKDMANGDVSYWLVPVLDYGRLG